MKKKQRFSFGTLVIVDLMATSFGVIVLLIIVVMLNEERLIVENAPVVNRIYNSNKKFKIISSQLSHGESLKQFNEYKKNKNKNDNSPTLYTINIYDNYIEYESFKGKLEKLTKDTPLEENNDFMEFLRKIKKEKHRLYIYIYENGMYYKFMDLVSAYQIGWYSLAPISSNGKDIYDEYINKDKNLNIQKKSKFINDNNQTKNQDINKTKNQTYDRNQTKFKDISETRNFKNQMQNLMNERIKNLIKNIFLLIILLIIIILEFRFHYQKYLIKKEE